MLCKGCLPRPRRIALSSRRSSAIGTGLEDSVVHEYMNACWCCESTAVGFEGKRGHSHARKEREEMGSKLPILLRSQPRDTHTDARTEDKLNCFEREQEQGVEPIRSSCRRQVRVARKRRAGSVGYETGSM